MARLARVVITGLAHHITQRGNGRQQVFFHNRDYTLYLRLIREACADARVSCLAYCLMPNHVHLILVPSTDDGLRRCLSTTHRAYAGILNASRRRTGHFWQGRYGSVPMDDPHLHEALRYVLLNPVRAGLVRSATDWRWSSARAYLSGQPDGFTDPTRMLRGIPDLTEYLQAVPDHARLTHVRAAESIGRPAGAADFIQQLERQTGRRFSRERPGRQPGGQHTPAPVTLQ